jgi:hypothetical protein
MRMGCSAPPILRCISAQPECSAPIVCRSAPQIKHCPLQALRIGEHLMRPARNFSPSIVDRRFFCTAIGILAAKTLAFSRVSQAFKREAIFARDGDYVIVNGWVLNRSDVAMIEATPNVV